MEEMSYAQAMRHYFGPRPGKEGESAATFMAEMKALTPEDKDFFKRELTRVGYQLKA